MDLVCLRPNQRSPNDDTSRPAPRCSLSSCWYVYILQNPCTRWRCLKTLESTRLSPKKNWKITTTAGFEPARAKPKRFLIFRLNHSAKLPLISWVCLRTTLSTWHGNITIIPDSGLLLGLFTSLIYRSLLILHIIHHNYTWWRNHRALDL